MLAQPRRWTPKREDYWLIVFYDPCLIGLLFFLAQKVQIPRLYAQSSVFSYLLSVQQAARKLSFSLSILNIKSLVENYKHDMQK